MKLLLAAVIPILSTGCISPASPTTKQPVVLTARIPAQLGIVESVPISSVRNGEGGFVYVPPRGTVTFLEGGATNWTHRPTTRFEQQLTSKEGADVDFGYVLRRVKEHNNDIHSAGREIFNDLVKLGLTAGGPDKGAANITEKFVKDYLSAQFPFLLTQWDGSPVFVQRMRCSSTDYGCILVLTRLMALATYRNNPSAFGPFYGLEGSASFQPGMPGFGNPGSLVIGRYQVDERAGKLVPSGYVVNKAQPFNTPGDKFYNDDACPVWVRIGINDDYPEDNGIAGGFAQVSYSVD